MAQRKTTQRSAKTMTSGTAIRFEQPKSHRKPKPKVTAEIRPVGNFADFLREHTVVTLAIGFVIATQVQGLVKQLVNSFIDPLSKLLFGTALSQRTFTLHFHHRAANFDWGALAYGIVDFILVIVTIYIIIRFFKLDKLDKPKQKK